MTETSPMSVRRVDSRAGDHFPGAEKAIQGAPADSRPTPTPRGVCGTDGSAEDERTDRGLSALPEIRPVTAPARLASAHECRDGWLGTEDQPRPCPYCRPHLTRGRQGWRVNPNLLRKDQTP